MTGLPKRTNPRRRSILRLEAGRSSEERVLNVSLNGLFVENARAAEATMGALWLPGADRPLELNFRQVFRRGNGVGVQFEPADRRTRHDLHDFVTHQTDEGRLRAFEAKTRPGVAANLKPLGEIASQRDVFRPLERRSASVLMYGDSNVEPVSARLAAVDAQSARLTLLMDAAPRGQGPQAFEPVILALPNGEVVYLADTVVERTSGPLTTVLLPERTFLPERRSLDRELARERILRIERGGVRLGEVVEEDANGLAVWFFPADAEAVLHGGATDGVLIGAGHERRTGPLRVAWSRPEPGGRVRIGFERLHPRSEFTRTARTFTADPPLARALASVQFAIGAVRDRIGLGSVPPPRVWTLEQASGRPLVHLVNATFDFDRPPPGPIHVVLIPPPYGRRKETPSALAAVLLAGFRGAGLPLVVLRWDGRNHVGESWRDPQLGADHPMLHYTQTQAVADLASTIVAVKAHFGDRELRTAAISFSLAAVAVRRYLASGGAGIDAWIAPMGAADARDTIRNGNGGVDLVGEKKRGATLGIRLIQGQLVDADRHCTDLIEGGFADLEDARRDMAQITQPVTWISGLHDYWVNTNRVRDILAVPAPGDRELIEVPAGHFLRTSNEALATFRMITERVLFRLTGRAVAAKAPDPFTVRRMGELERARLARPAFDAVSWWRDYLLGNRDNPLGFDLLALTDEYADLLDTQVELLALRAGERVADLGCGTGNMLAALVRQVGDRLPGVQIEALDLVPEALDRARDRVRVAAREIGVPAPLIRFQAADLTLVDRPNLPFADGALDAAILSLVLPYIEDPRALLAEVFRILKPGGRVVISSLRPDVDTSGPVARLREKLARGDTQLVEGWSAGSLGVALGDYLNRAAALVDLEVEGRFRFHERSELEELVASAGFRRQTVVETFGTPPLAVVLVAIRPAA